VGDLLGLCERLVPLAPEEEHGDDVREQERLPGPVAKPPGESETFARALERGVVAVAVVEGVGEVVVGPQRRRDAALESNLERVLEQREALLRPSPREDQHASLRIQRLREHLRQRDGLGQLERLLDPLRRPLGLAHEEEQPAELGGERRQVLVRRVLLEHDERPLHALDGLVDVALGPGDLAQAGGEPGGGMRLPLCLEKRDRTFELARGGVAAPSEPRHLPGAFEELGLLERAVGELGRLLEIALRLLACGKRGRTLAGPGEHLARPCLDRRSICVLGRRLVGLDKVRRDDLDHLMPGGPERLLEVGGRGQVARLPLPLGERLVGNALEQVLEEAVLAALGRTRIGLQRQHLLAHEAADSRFSLLPSLRDPV
jgi:hypothetical protein